MTRRYKYDVAISYAIEDRAHAEALAGLLRETVSGFLRMNKTLIRWFIVSALVASAFVLGWNLKAKDGEVDRRYLTIVSDIEGQVYDGDTILDVAVGLPVEVKEAIDSEYPVQIWPGIYQDGTSVYAQVDLRILGIDAPEHRVSTRLSDEERARIKALAAESEQYLETLLNMSLIPGLIIVDRPKYGKYVGRVVADVKNPVLMAGGKIVPLSAVKGGESYIELSVTDAMLEAGMAEVYDD